MRRFHESHSTAALLLFAAAIRFAVVHAWHDRLLEDVDAYRDLAVSVRATGTLESSLSQPSAYRPPLYPLLIAPLVLALDGYQGIGRLHVLLGVATVALTVRIGRRLGLGRFAWLAGWLVAIDPLLLQYTAWTMTETVFTFLVTLLVSLLVTERDTDERTASDPNPDGGRAVEVADDEKATNADTSTVQHRAVLKPSTLVVICGLLVPLIYPGWATRSDIVAAAVIVALILLVVYRNRLTANAAEFVDGLSAREHSAAVGLVFGLAALCRPTIWAFAGLMFLFGLCKSAVNPRRKVGGGWRNCFDAVVGAWPAVVAAVVVVAPWGIRNQIQFGRPILTTTHGGYTLLLGNNPVFYREVVDRPWGTVWAGRSLARWQNQLAESMRADGLTDAGELEQDRWHYRRARENIREQPAMFLRACVLRFRRFWNIAPTGVAAESFPAWMLGAVRVFYAVITIGLIAFVVRIARRNLHGCSTQRTVANLRASARPGECLRENRTSRAGVSTLLLLVITFNSVHLIYWTNMRMRAPLIPVLCVMSVAGWFGLRGRQTDYSSHDEN